MKQEGLLFFTDTYLLWFGFALFFVTFLILMYRLCQAKNQAFYKQMSQLPLDEESSDD